MNLTRSSFALSVGVFAVGALRANAVAETHPATHPIALALGTLAEALKAGDGVAAASIFAPDSLIIAPGDFVRGRDAIAARYTKRLATKKYLDAAFTTLSVTGTADLAIEVGTSRFSISDAGAPATASTGRYLTVWRKSRDGAWQIESDAPIADPAPAA